MKPILMIVFLASSVWTQEIENVKSALYDDDPDVREQAVKSLIEYGRKNRAEVERLYNDTSNIQIRGLIAAALSEIHAFSIEPDEKETASLVFAGEEIILDRCGIICNECGLSAGVDISPQTNFRKTSRVNASDPVYTILSKGARFRLYVYGEFDHKCAEDCEFSVVISGFCPETRHPLTAKSSPLKLDKILTRISRVKG